MTPNTTGCPEKLFRINKAQTGFYFGLADLKALALGQD